MYQLKKLFYLLVQYIKRRFTDSSCFFKYISVTPSPAYSESNNDENKSKVLTRFNVSDFKLHAPAFTNKTVSQI